MDSVIFSKKPDVGKNVDSWIEPRLRDSQWQTQEIKELEILK